MSIYLLKDHLVLSTELIKHNYPCKCKCGGVTKKEGVSKIYEENV